MWFLSKTKLYTASQNFSFVSPKSLGKHHLLLDFIGCHGVTNKPVSNSTRLHLLLWQCVFTIQVTTANFFSFIEVYIKSPFIIS